MSDFQNRPEFDPNRPVTTRGDTAWGWIGAAAVVIVLVLIFAFGGRSTNTASNTGQPGSTIGQTTGSGGDAGAPARRGPATNGYGMNR